MNMARSRPLTEPARFGERYWLTRLLAVGGMAEIYLARQNAMAGFEKEVVIKRLKPELAANPRLVEMFLDEARIGALLNHPNIVHVYDVDEQAGIPYIAMEYIVGEQLNTLCRRGLSLGNFLPLEHAVELIRQAASGMGYFHAKRGDDSSRYDIVHCDVSPTNLLVTEDGFMKVIDFGIARSKTQRRDEGTLPGKLSYMAPEQALRHEVDHRTDIYALGIVLYEITVGKRLFKGTPQEVVRRLTEGEIAPPTFVRRRFPGGLETVVMRCLERHPADRYQSAYDLADELAAFLRDAGLRSGEVRIARYLDELAQAAGGARRPELIAEAERVPADEELDFERGMFDGYRSAQSGGGAVRVGEWDDDEEDAEEVAAALGLELEELQHLRTPVPLEETGSPPSDSDEPPKEPTVSSSAEAPDRTAESPDRIAESPNRAAESPAQRPAASSVSVAPWMLVGSGLGIATLGTVLYLLLS